MAMKIRNRFLASLLTLTVALLAAAAFLTMRGMERLKKELLTLAVANADSITEKNMKLSRLVLAKAGERFVEMNCAAAATRLRYVFAALGKTPTYAELRSNPEIREIATAEINGFGKKAAVAGRMDLLDVNGEAVLHHNPSVEGKNYRVWKTRYPEMWKLVERSFSARSVSGYYTFIDADGNPVRKFMALSRVRDTPFIVCASVEIRNFFIPVLKKIRRIELEARKTAGLNMRSASRLILNEIFRSGVAAAVLLLLVGVLLALWQSETLASPIRDLAKQAKAIGDGDFSAKVAEKGALETRLLARSFNNLGAELAEYMENLKNETAAREAMESEVKIARGIQEAMIPSSEHPFPNRTEFEMFASLTPAKEVSGDFYDYFQLDEETLAIVVADVSGKGLPAAIFMAVTRTLIRNLRMNAGTDDSPSAIMRKSNDYLCVDNEACMFVTAFLAYYNFKTGVMSYANAGHNPYVLLKKAADSPITGGVLSDFPLGLVPGHEFSEGELVLESGDSIFLYTDGVTEATDPEKAMFGEKRMLTLLKENKERSPKEIVETLVARVLEFEGGTRFDDVTVLALKRN